MSNMNLLFSLNTYDDSAPTNSPNRQNFKWTRALNSLPVNNPTSIKFTLAPGETRAMFNTTRTLSQDNTTAYNLTLKPLTTCTYILNNSGGTAPNFRTPRTTGADSTSALNVVVNNQLATFSSAPNTFAAFVGQIAGMTTDISLKAVVIGSGGNSIALSFDGTTSVGDEIAAWNTANPGNTIAIVSGDTTQIPSVGGSIVFVGGNTYAPLNLISGGVIVGDNVVIGNQFNILNQGKFTVVALTSTSFTVLSPAGVSEGPIPLTSDFANQLQIFSAAGVQVGDTLLIGSGFSPYSWGSYSVTAVYANSLEFSSSNPLPAESGIVTEVTIYEISKSFLYLESDSNCSVSINGAASGGVQPFVCGPKTFPGLFVRTSTMYSVSITNNALGTATLFLASAE